MRPRPGRCPGRRLPAIDQRPAARRPSDGPVPATDLPGSGRGSDRRARLLRNVRERPGACGYPCPGPSSRSSPAAPVGWAGRGRALRGRHGPPGVIVDGFCSECAMPPPATPGPVRRRPGSRFGAEHLRGLGPLGLGPHQHPSLEARPGRVWSGHSHGADPRPRRGAGRCAVRAPPRPPLGGARRSRGARAQAVLRSLR